MRLLLASDHYPPFIGGAHRQARLLATGMAERGHSVEVVTPWHPGLPERAEEGTVVVHRLKEVRTMIPALVRRGGQRHQPPYPDPVTVLGIRRVIRDFRPELIHAYGWLAFSVAASIGRGQIPLLVSARDYGYFCAARTLLRDGAPCAGPAPAKCMRCAGRYYGRPKGWAAVLGVGLSRRLLVRRMTGMHSVSTYVDEVTRRFLLGSSDRTDGRLAVEVTIPSFQEQPAAEAGRPADPRTTEYLSRLPDEPFILFVGAFRRVKGLETLFEAYRRLESPPPLVLIGTYERDSPGGFPDDAVVLTDAPHEAVMAAWDRALFGVMPSLWPEPLGSTVAEAMARGKPVIGTRLGGHTDLVDADSGVLVPQGDPAALARAMEDLIADPQRREAYGRAAAKRAREFTAPVVLPLFEQAYRDLIAASPGPPPA
jgi:glycosyltransferase involved in cell wall biosynthesis